MIVSLGEHAPFPDRGIEPGCRHLSNDIFELLGILRSLDLLIRKCTLNLQRKYDLIMLKFMQTYSKYQTSTYEKHLQA